MLQARDQAVEGKAAEEARLFKLQVELAEAQKAAASIPDLDKELSRYRHVHLVPCCLCLLDSSSVAGCCLSPLLSLWHAEPNLCLCAVLAQPKDFGCLLVAQCMLP